MTAPSSATSPSPSGRAVDGALPVPDVALDGLGGAGEGVRVGEGRTEALRGANGPRVRLAPELVRALSPCQLPAFSEGEEVCGGVNGFHADDCPMGNGGQG